MRGARCPHATTTKSRAARGIYEDKSGPIAVEWLRSRGFDTPDAVVIEDRQIIDYFNTLIADGKKNNNLPTFILTSGSTVTILITGVWDGNLNGVSLTQAAFATVFANFGLVLLSVFLVPSKIGRASCRERV